LRRHAARRALVLQLRLDPQCVLDVT